MWSTAVSLLLHVGVGAALFLTFSTMRPPEPPVRPAMAIELAPVSAPPAPPELLASGPQQVESHTQSADEPDAEKPPPAPEIPALNPAVIVPVSKPQTQHPPLPKQDAKPDTEQTSKLPPASQTTAPTSAPLPPKPISAAPVQGTPTASDQAAQQTWEGQVLAKLERKKRYPPESQKAGEQDTVYVHISVDRTGRVLAAAIAKSRGYARLDAASLDLVRRASPLPAPPASVRESEYTFDVPIEFIIGRSAR